MVANCINKNTTFYKTIVEQGFNPDEISQITDKLTQDNFIEWYGKGELDTFGQPRLVKDLYLVNDKAEQITLNDLLNDKFYEKRENYSADLTSLDKINKFLEESKVSITKRISAYKDTEYAEKLTKLLEDLNKLNAEDYLQGLQKHSEYILKTVEDLELALYNYDKVNTSKLSKEAKVLRDKKHKNFLIHASSFLQTFSKIKDLDLPVNNAHGREIIKKLKDIEHQVTALQNRINAEVEAAVRDTLNELISNPEVKAGAIDFLAAQTDESKVQLLLDALGDSHVTFIAAIDKFFKRAMYDKDNEVRQMNRDWDKKVEEIERKYGTFENFLDKILDKKDGVRTGKFIQKYKEEYYTQLFELRSKLEKLDKNSKEYKDALDEYYTWKKDNTEQKYVKEYYDALNLLTPAAREIKERIDLTKSSILIKGENHLTDADYDLIADLDKEMKSFKSTTNPDGTKKQGEALEIANSLYKYSKAMGQFYYTQGIKQKQFDKAKKEAEERGELDMWLKHNTKETFHADFWNFFKKLVAGIPKSEALIKLEDEIKQLTITYKNEKGELMLDNMPSEVLKELKELEAKKADVKKTLNKGVPLMQKRKLAEEFKKHIVFTPSSEYVKTLAAKRKVLEELETTQSSTSKVYLKAKEEFDRWYDENHELNTYTNEETPIALWTVMRPKNQKFIITTPNNKWNVTAINPIFNNPNFGLDFNGYAIPNEKWINDDYKNLSDEDLSNLNYIQDRLLYLTEHTKNDIIKKGFLPAIPKDIRNIPDTILNKKEKKEEKDFSEKAITETDEIVKFIPFKYVKKLNQKDLPKLPINGTEEEIKKIEEERARISKENAKAHGENLDYNLKDTMKTFTNVALTSKYKTNIETDIKLFKEQLKRQKIKQTDAKGAKIFDKLKGAAKGEKVEHEVSGVGSNTEKHFNAWLESIFYEEYQLEEGKLADWAAKIQDFTSLRALGFNVLSGVNNKVIANLQARIESAGGIYFEYKDYRKARVEYFKNITHFVANHKTATSNNYHDAYMKHFDVLISQDELSNAPDGAVKTVLHKIAMIKNAAFFMQHIGEHQVQNTALLSMSYSHRIIDGKIVNFNEFYEHKKIKINFDSKMTNEEINKEYENDEKNYILKENLKEEFENYPTVFESFELNDGLLSQKEGVKIDELELFNFKTRVIGVNQRLHGIYNTDDAGTWQREAIGRLAMQFRKWMRPGWNRRFGNKFGKKVYNERVRDYEEGMYVSTFKFLTNPLMMNYKEYQKNETKSAYLAFQAILTGLKETLTTARIRWHTLSEIEKANVKRTAAEFLFLMSVIAIGFLAKSLKGEDDEDKKALTFVLYQADRLFGELTTFTPLGIVREGNRLFTAPSPIFSTLEDVSKLGANMFMYPFRDDESRLFKSGIYHGQDKVSIYAKDLIPVYTQWQRLLYMNDNIQRYGLFK